MGKPNVGKSTLLNLLLGEKISIISCKPQTTRHQIKGIFTDDKRQIVFVDTPGYLLPRYELHNKMLEYLHNAIKDADVHVFITDAISFPTQYDELLLQLLKNFSTPKIAILNKIDLTNEEVIREKKQKLSQFPFSAILETSLHDAFDVNAFLDAVTDILPVNPPFYPPEHISDLPMRFFAQEIIREKIFDIFKEEIPYSTTVTVEEYKELYNKIDIMANIWIERKSQKPIIIGTKGENISKIRKQSEHELYRILNKRISLHIWIKVKPNWRKKKNAIKELGYL